MAKKLHSAVIKEETFYPRAPGPSWHVPDVPDSGMTFIDNYCGAGGNTIALKAAGIKGELAINHSPLAIETHSTNNPELDHACMDMFKVRVEQFGYANILVASPECTEQSSAKGSKRRSAQLALLEADEDNPLAERSRMTMAEVYRWAKYHRNEFIIIENVTEVRNWHYWDKWYHDMLDLGYEAKILCLNSIIAWPCPQSRDRLYGVFWRKGLRAPNLDFRPWAYCPKCEKDVQAVQAYRPGKHYGKLGKQYDYCCPHCGTKCSLYYFPAASAINWALPIPTVGSRKKPIKETTLDRIRAGVKKFGLYPQEIDLARPQSTYGRSIPLNQPMRVITGAQTQGVTIPPFLFDTVHTPRGDNYTYMVWGIDAPNRAQLGVPTHGLAMPPGYMVATNHSGQPENYVWGIDGPIRTVDGTQGKALVTPPYMVSMRGEDMPTSVDEPLRTVTGGGKHHALIVPYYHTGTARTDDMPLPTQTGTLGTGIALPPFLVSIHHSDHRHMSGVDKPAPTVLGEGYPNLVTAPGAPWITGAFTRDAVSGIDVPLPTQCGQPRHYLTLQPDGKLDVSDFGFRMLTWQEIRHAMAFPYDYIIKGSDRDKIYQLGQAVTPSIVYMIAQAIVESVG